ncbi:hypothetical protein ACLOAV_004761 [Pseudogymnoascus australis]
MPPGQDGAGLVGVMVAGKGPTEYGEFYNRYGTEFQPQDVHKGRAQIHKEAVIAPVKLSDDESTASNLLQAGHQIRQPFKANPPPPVLLSIIS